MNHFSCPHQHRWQKALQRTTQRVGRLPYYRTSGRVVRATGMVIEVVGLRVAVGSACPNRASRGRWPFK